ncbi:hypothetical protein ABT381_18765 [Streptomyces sp. NPDC000151]|uniref:hypothetical protein n=1 Tax=Streptomyces sp. NPDC000151 TaxID=3154244 RepID=UPI00332E2C51
MNVGTLFKRSAALTAAALISLPALAGTAAAAPPEMYAPHAQAAAQVAANGTLLAAKNVSSSWLVGKAGYCVVVSDPDVTLNDAVVVGTTNDGQGTYSIDVRREPTSTCGNRKNAITVFTAYGTTANPVKFTVAVL